MFWQGIRQPWWAAFVVTWIVVAIVLRVTGSEPNDAVRIAGVAGAAVALAIWVGVRVVARRRAPGEES